MKPRQAGKRRKSEARKTKFNSSDMNKDNIAEENEIFTESFHQGTSLLHQGRAGESVPFLEQSYHISPNNSDVVINLGGAYIMTKKFSKAVLVLELASREYPEHARIWINLGAAYLGNPILARMEDQDKAISAFKQALEIDPIAPSVAYNLGLIYRDRGETEDAKYWFRQAIKHNPTDQDARNLLKKLELEE